MLSYEDEAPVMSREDGVERCTEYLPPLVIEKPLEAVWW